MFKQRYDFISDIAVHIYTLHKPTPLTRRSLQKQSRISKKKKLINKESKLVPKDSNIHNTSLSSFLHFVVRPDYILQRIRQLLIKLQTHIIHYLCLAYKTSTNLMISQSKKPSYGVLPCGIRECPLLISKLEPYEDLVLLGISLLPH